MKPEIPESIKKLILYGVSLTKPESVVLFGSRARGDQHEKSDFDLAFKNVQVPEAWSQFTTDYSEKPISLFPCDLMIYENATQEYRDIIDREGITLYENGHFLHEF